MWDSVLYLYIKVFKTLFREPMDLLRIGCSLLVLSLENCRWNVQHKCLESGLSGSEALSYPSWMVGPEQNGELRLQSPHVSPESTAGLSGGSGTRRDLCGHQERLQSLAYLGAQGYRP